MTEMNLILRFLCCLLLKNFFASFASWRDRIIDCKGGFEPRPYQQRRKGRYRHTLL
jgi:hypothetical protein